MVFSIIMSSVYMTTREKLKTRAGNSGPLPRTLTWYDTIIKDFRLIKIHMNNKRPNSKSV